uniref:Uncharacterized protein n=1 Tax=Dulem virus 35 TaxID=3145753 RepID=A0AAU8B157_9CAUD
MTIFRSVGRNDLDFLVVRGPKNDHIILKYYNSFRSAPYGVLAGVGRVVRKLTHDASPHPATKDINGDSVSDFTR